MTRIELPPLSLYIHFPWCVRKCPYCDFNSHALRGDEDERAYIDALLRDLDFEISLISTRPIQSLFIGGGTPSLISAGGVSRLLEGVAARLTLPRSAEITLEANPGAVDAKAFLGYRQAGVNRLSLGVQSFDGEKLAALGRIHSGEEASRAYVIAREAGFDNINLDLMFGLPEQSLSEAMRDLERALTLGPEHLSWYQLTLEPNTLFYQQPPSVADSDSLWEMQESGLALLRASGFQRYEVSAYAAEEGCCRHNLNYWRFGDYMGIGAGAHGKLTLEGGEIHRRWRQRHPAAYMDGVGGHAVLAGERRILARELPLEFMLNALRLSEGVPAELYTQRTGLVLADIAEILGHARERKLLSEDASRLRATELGARFHDDLVAMFLPEEA